MKAGLIGSFVVFGIIGYGIYTAVLSAPESESTPSIQRTTFIDTSEAAMLTHERVNLERARAGVAQLEWNEDLTRVALAHSQDQAERGYFDHVSPDGDTFRTRYNEGGINCFGSENLAYVDGVNSNQELAENAFLAWMESSEGHRENMLDDMWSSEGIGIAAAGNAFYITQNFCH